MRGITRVLGTILTFSVLPLVKASFSDPKQPQQTQVAQVQTKVPISKQPNLAKTYLDNLKEIKVAYSISQNTGEHSFDYYLFQANINSFEVLLKDNPELAAKYFAIIDDRLKTETNPRNRGMLYKALAIMSKGPKSSEVINKFTKAIVTEDSLITTKMLGEALSGEFIREFTGRPNIKLQKHYRSFFRGVAAEWFDLGNDDAKNLIKGCFMLNKNFRDFKASRSEIKSAEKENNKQILAFLVKVIKLQDRNNLGALEELFGDSISIKDRAAIERVFKNTNSILGGFGNKLLQDSEGIFNCCNLYKKESMYPLDNLFQSREAIAITLGSIQKELELNIDYSPIPAHPAIAAALIQLNYSKKTFDEAANKLNESLFNGKKKFATYQIYEGQLLNNCFNAYYESKKYKNDNDLSVREAHCQSLVAKLQSILSAPKADTEDFSRVVQALHSELLYLDGKLYTDRVRTPLQELRVNFIKDFISLAPSGRRLDYLNITLDQLCLRGKISKDEIKRIVSD